MSLYVSGRKRARRASRTPPAVLAVSWGALRFDEHGDLTAAAVTRPGVPVRHAVRRTSSTATAWAAPARALEAKVAGLRDPGWWVKVGLRGRRARFRDVDLVVEQRLVADAWTLDDLLTHVRSERGRATDAVRAIFWDAPADLMLAEERMRRLRRHVEHLIGEQQRQEEAMATGVLPGPGPRIPTHVPGEGRTNLRDLVAARRQGTPHLTSETFDALLASLALSARARREATDDLLRCRDT